MDDADVLVYTGAGGAEVPNDVVRVRVDPSVTSIPARAFERRNKLTEVELCEGVVEIGKRSFGYCDHSITSINIPNSLRRICNAAFYDSLQTPVCLHDGIESIGEGAFAACIFTNFRVPPLITVIPKFMLCYCRSMFSLEVHEDISEIKDGAFYNCPCLRNVAFPPDVFFVGYQIFIEEEDDDDNDNEMELRTDLQLLFGNSNAAIIRELLHRFDGLPIHRLIYYQSYHQGVLHTLIAAINTRSSQRRTLRNKLDTTGNQQDCLGMTPLHILACSSVHDLEVYRVIVENYPTNLITEDRWGAVPLLYAFWGAAPTEIIQFLLESYQSLYPDHVFNWTNMVETMGRCDTPKENIENLLCVKQMHFPEQPIDWEYLLDEFALNSNYSFSGAPFQDRMQFLVMRGMSERVEALAFKVWRVSMTNMIHTAAFVYDDDDNDDDDDNNDDDNNDDDNNEQSPRDNTVILREIREKLAHFEDEMPRLEEATTILELALWKNMLDVNSKKMETNRCQKKMRSDESDLRQQCRVTCGADVVIGHVMPFLIGVCRYEYEF
jgi:hypothetical protein